MTSREDSHGVRNQISGGLYFNAVIQGAHVTLQLPATVPPALTGMPTPSPAFTGRISERDTLLAALRPGREGKGTSHVIAGLPGVGKTELALQVAHHALNSANCLPGGVLFIDLFGYDDRRRVGPHRALGSLLRSLAVPDEYVPDDVEDRARLYRSVLAAYAAEQRRILLILDNAMNSAQVRPLLPGDPRIPVLITSRHSLSDLGVRLLDLSVLDQRTSVEFIERSLREVVGPTDTRVADEPEAAGEVASLCGRLPLALSVVAALLADIPARPLHSMATALSNARHRLERLSREDLAVRAAFDLSYQHLRPDQARLFRLLPLNPGPDLSTEALSRMAGLAVDDAEQLLLSLARGHFIEPGSSYGRWRMHDLIRLFADDLGRAQDGPRAREEAVNWLLQHYVTTTHAADTHIDVGVQPDPHFPDLDAALTWLDAERHNLLAAALAAPELGQPEALLQLHFSLIDYQSLRRHFDEHAELALAALAAIRSPAHPTLRVFEASVLNNLATAQRELRRFQEAVASYQEAQSLHALRGDTLHVAATLNNLGLTYQQMNRPEEAVDVLRQALALYPPETDPRVRGMAYTNLGKALHSLRRLQEAAEALTEDITICQEIGDRAGEGVALNNLGMVLRDMGQLPAAADAHRRALAAAKEAKDLYSEGLAQANLGLVLALGREGPGPGEAINRITAAVDILDSLGEEHMAALARNHLGMVFLQTSSPEEAIAPLSSVLDVSRRAGDPYTEATALTNLGTALELSGRYSEAVQAQREAVALCRHLGERHREAQALFNLGLALRRTGDLRAADDAFGESATAFQETGDEAQLTKVTQVRNETGK
ncbi:tetratricopeptide repeat protein [Streptomyces sp. DT2A-34]|uniref:tetratricopeptide repeat protein n=1 Tax=Streptomyces sp. DT2A-34 TaxID=3051182 RepID=UPI00265BBBC4|nr:tetratricopeptide repeat protein [Streptomyces sp. DT2A-34]MDO0913923.1 tetratricopeptide repeat protein [Streptomyces sp. DT2A-34]